MSLIRKEKIDAANNIPISEVWQRVGLDPVADGKMVVSPWRTDTRPSVQVGGGLNMVKDYGGDGETLDCVALVRRQKGLGFQDAVAWLLGCSVEEITEPEPEEQLEEIADPIERFARARGFSVGVLKRLGARGNNNTAPKEIVFPMRNADGEEVGTRKRRADNKVFSGDTKALCDKGSQQGLIYEVPFPENDLVVVCEGEADACACMMYWDGPVLATPGANPSKACMGMLHEMASENNTAEYVLFQHGDRAGATWQQRVGRQISGAEASVTVHAFEAGDLDDALKALPESERREKLKHWICNAQAWRDGMLYGQASGGKMRVPVPSAKAEEQTSDMARIIFQALAKRRDLFYRGSSDGKGELVELVHNEQVGGFELHQLNAQGFRSRADERLRFVAYEKTRTRTGEPGEIKVKNAVLSADLSACALNSAYCRDLMPRIIGVVNCPIMTQDGRVLGPGFDEETGWFVSHGEPVPDVSVGDAVKSIKDLLLDFDFNTPGDESRAIVSIITPAMKFSKFLTLTPMDMAEADQSQSGKTFRHKLIAAIYNEHPQTVTVRKNGVGSFDESFGTRLLEGRPFIQIDNLRGKLDSQTLEAFFTSEKTFPVRVAHRTEVNVDPSVFYVMATSNSFSSTVDLANRCSIIRIRKRPQDYAWREYAEGDVLDHVRARQAYYLGCVFAVVRAWIAAGKPQSAATEHDFRKWARPMDWIVQNVFDCAPLMEGHNLAKLTVSNTSLNWLRQVVARIASSEKLDAPLYARDIESLCTDAGIDIPGARQYDQTNRCMAIGRIRKELFKGDTDRKIDVDETYTVCEHQAAGDRIGESHWFLTVTRKEKQ